MQAGLPRVLHPVDLPRCAAGTTGVCGSTRQSSHLAHIVQHLPDGALGTRIQPAPIARRSSSLCPTGFPPMSSASDRCASDMTMEIFQSSRPRLRCQTVSFSLTNTSANRARCSLSALGKSWPRAALLEIVRRGRERRMEHKRRGRPTTNAPDWRLLSPGRMLVNRALRELVKTFMANRPPEEQPIRPATSNKIESLYDSHRSGFGLVRKH